MKWGFAVVRCAEENKLGCVLHRAEENLSQPHELDAWMALYCEMYVRRKRGAAHTVRAVSNRSAGLRSRTIGFLIGG